MSLSRNGLTLSLIAAVCLAAAPAGAVVLKLDYSLDTNHFFDVGTPSRAALEAAAGFYSNLLTDTLSLIQPPVFTGLAGTVRWHWTIGFNHPSGLSQYTLQDQTLLADEYRIYAGAEAYTGNTLAVGSPGAIGNPCCPRTGPSPSSFTSSEAVQIYAIDASFENAMKRRGETSGFAAWGGAISFENDPSTNWHFDHTTPPPAGKIDLYSVALHELAHTLGFGASAEWTALVSGSSFTGNAAKTRHGGPVPLAAGNSHWQEGLGSKVYGGTDTQTAAMTPGIAPQIRKRLTALDAAALTDLGWELLPGDYNSDGIVNAADYTMWRNTRGQTGANLLADGNHSGVVEASDYALWKSNFGQLGAGSGNLESVEVPEVESSILLIVAAIVAALRRFRLSGLSLKHCKCKLACCSDVCSLIVSKQVRVSE